MPSDRRRPDSSSDLANYLPAAKLVRGAGEVVFFSLVVLSPWPFASNEPPFESALSAGVLLLTALWAVHAAIVGSLSLRPDVVSVCLSGMALWSAVQLVPLPERIVGWVSPARLEWHRTLLPAESELLPGEADPIPRPTSLPLTIVPAETRTFLARTLGVLLVYAAARNWLASRGSFRRFAWALAANGVALSVFALCQFVSSPGNVVYWGTVVEGGAFGPFICRNHFSDYIALCLGLTGGLLLANRAGRDGSTLPGAGSIGLIAAAGIMLVGTAFS